jgi:hypothetical protein
LDCSNLQMIPTTLTDAYRLFTAAADQLRGKHVLDFESTLKSALAGNPHARRNKIQEAARIARDRFSDEFVGVKAPLIFRDLNSNIAEESSQGLKLFDAGIERGPLVEPRVPSDQAWQPGMVRTMLGAAFGAIAALLLLAPHSAILGGADDQSNRPVVSRQSAGPASVPGPGIPPLGVSPATSDREGATPRVVPSAAPGQGVPTSRVGTPLETIEALAAGLAAAIGAAVGAFVVICPPLRLLLRNSSSSRAFLGLIDRFGAAIGFLSRKQLFAVAGVFAIGLVALGIWLLFADHSWQAPFGILAALAIVYARSTSPKADSNGDADLHRATVDLLDRALMADACVLSAVAAGMVMRSGGPGKSLSQPFDRLREIVLSRQKEGQTLQMIWPLVLQSLGITFSDTISENAEQSEFVWGREHSDRYNTFGNVNIGDAVVVLTSPTLNKNADGSTIVVSKGEVARQAR